MASKFVIHVSCSKNSYQIELSNLNKTISNFYKKFKINNIIPYEIIITSTGFTISYDISFINKDVFNEFKELFNSSKTFEYISNIDDNNMITKEMLIVNKPIKINSGNLELNHSHSKSGMVYVIYGVGNPTAKIGYWTSDEKSLYGRYNTVFGDDLIMKTYHCNKSYQVEQSVLKQLKTYIKCGELIFIEHLALCEPCILSTIKDINNLEEIIVDFNRKQCYSKEDIERIEFKTIKTKNDIYILANYYFSNIIHDLPIDDEIKKSILNVYFLNKEKRNCILNIMNELNLIKLENKRLKFITVLCDMLKLKNSLDTKTKIDEESVLEYYEYYNNMSIEEKNIFDKNFKIGELKAKTDVLKAKQLINLILKIWNEGSFTRELKTNLASSKVRTRIYKYMISKNDDIIISTFYQTLVV